MTIKRHISLIILMLCIATGAQAQLVFEQTVWDFGALAEVDGKVSHTFIGTNKGEKPLVILDVMTTCGCTVPKFSRQPIKPGGKLQISVTFDPANRPGAFHKELRVYSSERKKVATLAISGTVTPRPKTTEELYPVQAGDLRLTTNSHAFSYIYIGKQAQTAIGYINPTSRTLLLELRPEQASGLLTTHHTQRIAPGQEGEINLSYLIPADKPHYGMITDVLDIQVDGHTTDRQLIIHGIGVDSPPRGETKTPRAEMSENILKFGPVKHTGSVQQQRFVLHNAGRDTLIVRALDGLKRISTTLRAGQRIAPGGSFEAVVTLDPAKQEFGVLSERIGVITNDPVRPLLRLRITAIIEQ